jgi:hypothetical protein
MPDRPTDDDPLTVELELVDVLAVLRMLDDAGVAEVALGSGEVTREQAAAAVRVDDTASRALFPAGSSIAGMLPAILGRAWRDLAELDARRVLVKPVPRLPDPTRRS